MTYVDVKEFAREFRVTGDWLLTEAEAEFEKGDFVQASEKSWGAAAQHLKALATERDWGHDTHSHLAIVTERLVEETGNEEIDNLFDTAQALHANFYEAHWSEAAIRRRMDKVRRFVGILAAIPPPEQPPRRNHIRSRSFVRTRGGNP